MNAISIFSRLLDGKFMILLYNAISTQYMTVLLKIKLCINKREYF